MPALFLNRIMKLTIKIVICYFTTHEHFHRAYHINKKQWMTIELAEQVSDREIMSLVDMSFGLTKKKLKRRKKEEQYIAEVRK